MSESKETSQESPDQEVAPDNSSKKMMFILIGVIVVLLGVVVFLFTPAGKKMLGTAPEATEHVQEKKDEKKGHKELAFIKLPDMLVNLQSKKPQNAGKTNFFKLSIQLQLEGVADKEEIESKKPLFVDQFQVFLREMEPEDLQGSLGLQRLRQELLTRANLVASP